MFQFSNQSMPNSLHPIYEEHTLQSSLMTTPDQLSKNQHLENEVHKKKIGVIGDTPRYAFTPTRNSSRNSMT